MFMLHFAMSSTMLSSRKVTILISFYFPRMRNCSIWQCKLGLVVSLRYLYYWCLLYLLSFSFFYCGQRSSLLLDLSS